MLEPTLKQLLGDYQPKRLIVAGEPAVQIGTLWSQYAGADLTDLTDNPLDVTDRQAQVADLALITGVLGRLDHEQGRQFLGWLRNVGARRVVVSIGPDDGWTFNDLLGLAFHRHATFEDGTELFAYDIETYNRPRDWNNPKYWANPENWGKYRW